MCKFLSLAIITLTITACASKAITKPYSSIYSDAVSSGISMSTVEEERKTFFQSDASNKEKLVSIIKNRAAPTQEDKVYKIGPQDEIQINVFDVPELNTTVKVKESGLLDLALIGTIEAKGMTEAELLKEVTKRLKNFVINPQVTLFISNYGSQKVAVMGAVRNPGTYSLKKGSNSILELISEAGGLSDKAGTVLNFVPTEISGLGAANDVESRARFALGLDQAGNQNTKTTATGIEVYLDTLMGTSGNIPVEVPVRGGDMVIVPEAGKVMVEGEVEKVGAYDLGSQMSLLGALAAAGGITYSAKIDEVEIVRDNGGEKRAHLVLDLQSISTGEEKDIKLKNGDIVKVPSDSGRRLRTDTFENITKLISFGGRVN